MRISDWSSDVCSSDLTIAPITLRSSIVLPLDRPSVATLRPHIRPRLATFHPTFLSLGPVLATRLMAVSMIIAAPIMITLRELHLRQSWRQGCDGRRGHQSRQYNFPHCSYSKGHGPYYALLNTLAGMSRC